jgi:ATP-dependent Lon protease
MDDIDLFTFPPEPTVFPKEAVELLREEKLSKLSNERGEAMRIRNKAIRNFAWDTFAQKSVKIDLEAVEAEMNRHLYGFDKPKRQILRYLAAFNENPEAPIRPLLLIGPAGTGKSVFGKVIAKAINKPLKTISMPAISAGWEFTGTEKSYSSACCGIIIDSIIKAGELPVFLFDEVDKAGNINHHYASPQQGLLNLLDDSREKFTDTFFEVPINLKSAFFVLTANELKECNKYMANRCMIIDIKGYKKPEERRIILTDYILPKLFKEYNLPKSGKLLGYVIDSILSASSDPNGGLRILQKQAENIILEMIYRRQRDKSLKTKKQLLPPELVKSVLDELYQENPEEPRKIGFGR